MKIPFAILLLAIPLLAADVPQPGNAARIEGVQVLSRIQAGTRAVVAVKVKLEQGYHAHSNEPSEAIYVPTELKSTPPGGVTLLTVRYPKGRARKIAGLPKPLSIYEDEVEIRMVFKLDDDVTLPVKIPATLSYQACQGMICYRPARLNFEIVLPPAP